MEKIKYWFLFKWRVFLVLIGWNCPDNWIMFRIAIRDLGKDVATDLFIKTIQFNIKHSKRNTKKNKQHICEITEPKYEPGQKS